MSEPNRDRGRRMLSRIRRDLDAAPEPAPWIAAARTLSERLVISEDTLYYFVELFTECLISAALTSDAELARLLDELQAIERAHGLREDESFYLDDLPPEWTAANEAWDRRSYEIVAGYLRKHGHADVAALIESKPPEFERRAGAGFAGLWGEDDGSEEFD